MIGKLALAFSAPLLLSAKQAPPSPGLHFPLVHQVICPTSRGTAFRVGETRFLSVAHVTSTSGCTIGGMPFTAENNGEQDFSVLEVPIRKEGALKINCEGFKPGKYYWAVGYAKGWPWQTMVVLYATYVKHPNGMRVLLGSPTVIPGMSGGPVLDESGAVVGTVNAYSPGMPVSFSRELKDTSVCR